MSAEERCERRDGALWLQCACTALVALGAAYASYLHGREFALKFGADHAVAVIWPLIVDGLLIVATVELWKTDETVHSGRWTAWTAFVFGISLSLCANIAAAPDLNVFTIAVAACPPLALLLAVELLNRSIKRRYRRIRNFPETRRESEERSECAAEDKDCNFMLADPRLRHEGTAEERMWQHFESEMASGRRPTGAELDRIAGTNNYGRRVLRKWLADGRVALVDGGSSSDGPGRDGSLQRLEALRESG